MIEINITNLTKSRKIHIPGTSKRIAHDRIIRSQIKSKPVNPERAQEFWNEKITAERAGDKLTDKRGKTKEDYVEIQRLYEKKEAAWDNYIKADPEWKLYHEAHRVARDKQAVILDREVNPGSMRKSIK